MSKKRIGKNIYADKRNVSTPLRKPPRMGAKAQNRGIKGKKKG